MKILIVLPFLFLFFTSFASAIPENDKETIEGKLLEQLSLETVNQYIRKLNYELNREIPIINQTTVAHIASQGLDVNWSDLCNTMLVCVLSEITANANLMGKLILLAILCALLQNLQNSFEESAISVLAYSICYVFMMIIVLKVVYNIYLLAQQTVENMVGFMEALLPVLISLMAGTGGMTSSALLTPFMLFTVNAISFVIKDAVLPLLFFTCTLECINYLTDKYRLNNLTSLFKQAGMCILSLLLVLFIGVITIQGIAGSIADGLALRTAKFATATFVPVIGGVFADAVSTVMGASLLLKNTIGILGVIAVMIICFFPAAKILSIVLIMKVSGALIQPIGNEKLSQCLTGIGNNLLLIFAAVATVALMFFLTITLIIGISSTTMMLGR